MSETVLSSSKIRDPEFRPMDRTFMVQASADQPAIVPRRSGGAMRGETKFDSTARCGGH